MAEQLQQSSSSCTPPTWTPFQCLAVAEVTPAGLLQKESTEVEVMVLDHIELRSSNTEPLVPFNTKNQIDQFTMNKGKWIDRCTNLTIMLTTHRIVFIQQQQQTSAMTTTTTSTTNQQRGETRYLHHSQIFVINEENALFKSPKLLISTAALGELYIVFSKETGGSKSRDELYRLLSKTLTRQQWEHDFQKSQQHQQQQLLNKVQQLSNNKTSDQQVIVTRKVGVDAVLSKSAMYHQQASQLADTAFGGDAELLLQEATELVQIIHKYTATLDHQNSNSSDDDYLENIDNVDGTTSSRKSNSSSTNSNNNNDTQRLVGMLRDMGMTSALSKADFRGHENAYFDQTARQLADFILPKLQSIKVITLTDVYCLFNRARGSHLLSPEDIVRAAERCNELQLGFQLTEYPSGLKVLQHHSMNEQVLVNQFLQWIQNSNGPLTASYVSRQARIPVVLALEQLKSIERLGHLVRDETLETIRFYPNRFQEWVSLLSSRSNK